MKHQINIVLAAATLIVASDGFAQAQMQSPSVQASHGQSQARQSRDMDRCNTMARKETGVDPIAIAANATPLQPGKGITSTPIEAPSTAMGASTAGATAAGTGDMGAGQQMGNSASGQMSDAGAAQTGTATSNSNWATGTPPSAATGSSMAGSSSTGASTSGATGSSGSSGNTVAMADSADVYNQAFSKCMSSHGYVVGSTSQ